MNVDNLEIRETDRECSAAQELLAQIKEENARVTKEINEVKMDTRKLKQVLQTVLEKRKEIQMELKETKLLVDNDRRELEDLQLQCDEGNLSHIAYFRYTNHGL